MQTCWNANKTKCKRDIIQTQQNAIKQMQMRQDANRTKCKWDKMQVRLNANEM